MNTHQPPRAIIPYDCTHISGRQALDLLAERQRPLRLGRVLRDLSQIARLDSCGFNLKNSRHRETHQKMFLFAQNRACVGHPSNKHSTPREWHYRRTPLSSQAHSRRTRSMQASRTRCIRAAVPQPAPKTPDGDVRHTKKNSAPRRKLESMHGLMVTNAGHREPPSA